MTEKRYQSIKWHLEEFGNTIVTANDLFDTTLDELFERLRADGFVMYDPPKIKLRRYVPPKGSKSAINDHMVIERIRWLNFYEV